jgi:hypothetical protein
MGLNVSEIILITAVAGLVVALALSTKIEKDEPDEYVRPPIIIEELVDDVLT